MWRRGFDHCNLFGDIFGFHFLFLGKKIQEDWVAGEKETNDENQPNKNGCRRKYRIFNWIYKFKYWIKIIINYYNRKRFFISFQLRRLFQRFLWAISSHLWQTAVQPSRDKKLTRSDILPAQDWTDIWKYFKVRTWCLCLPTLPESNPNLPKILNIWKMTR